MSTNQPTPVILSDEALAEIEAQQVRASSLIDDDTEVTIAALISNVPALCATVRAAWAEIDEKLVQIAALREQLAAMERQRNSLRGLRGQVVGLNTRLAQVEQERNDLRSSLDAERKAVNVLAGEIKTVTNQRDEREVAEYIWCVNCGNRIYRSGGKWFHLSTAGMSCGVPAQAAPSSEYAATRMRERCVARVKEVPMPTHLSESGEEIVTHFRARVIRYLQSVTLEAAANSVDSEGDRDDRQGRDT